MSDDQKKKTTTRKSARPRLDAIVRHIVSGSYDDEIEKIQSAIDRRNQARQEAVLKTVKQVFGKDAEVRPGTTHNVLSARTRPNPFLKKGEGDELAAAEQAALEREKELAAAGGDPLGDDAEDDPDIESRSPIIGSVES